MAAVRESRGQRQRARQQHHDHETLALRAERAKLLGYATHAHWRVEIRWPRRGAGARADGRRCGDPPSRASARKCGTCRRSRIAKARTSPSRLGLPLLRGEGRQAKYDLDENEIKPYLQLDRLRDGMFWVAGELFGFRFAPVSNTPVFPSRRDRLGSDGRQPPHRYLVLRSVRAHRQAFRRVDGCVPRQEKFDGPVTTIVSNNSNFVRGKPGEPVLVSWDDAATLFHEFGHALHGLASDVNYPSVSGTAVPRDYVEFPSQLLEHWLSTPEVLQRFAVHHKTGEPLPKALVESHRTRATFNEDCDDRYLSAALVDMKLHLAGDRHIAPTRSAGYPEQWECPRDVMRHRIRTSCTSFQRQIFGWYYSYSGAT